MVADRTLLRLSVPRPRIAQNFMRLDDMQMSLLCIRGLEFKFPQGVYRDIHPTVVHDPYGP